MSYVRHFTRKENDVIDPYEKPSNFAPDPNETSHKNFVYVKYIGDFFWNSATEEPIEYPLERPNLWEERAPIFGSTFQLNGYSDEFLRKLFEDVRNISSKRKHMLYILSVMMMVSDILEPVP